MHHKRQAGLDAMFYGCLAGLGLGLVIGKLWLVVFAGLLYYVWLKDQELTRHANLHCAASRQAVRYRGQKHLQLIFEIDNRAYLEAFMATNPRDLGMEVVSVKD